MLPAGARRTARVENIRAGVCMQCGRAVLTCFAEEANEQSASASLFYFKRPRTHFTTTTKKMRTNYFRPIIIFICLWCKLTSKTWIFCADSYTLAEVEVEKRQWRKRVDYFLEGVVCIRACSGNKTKLNFVFSYCSRVFAHPGTILNNCVFHSAVDSILSHLQIIDEPTYTNIKKNSPHKILSYLYKIT